MLEGFAWISDGRPVRPIENAVYGPHDPEYAEYIEAQDELEWIESGAPPVEGGAPATPAMPATTEPVAVPAVALTVNQKQAAALLGVHPDTFRDHVLPHLRVVQVTDSLQRIPVRELEQYVNDRKTYALRSQR